MSLDVLFINPPSVPYHYVERALRSKELDIAQAISMPMGILYLSAVLRKDFPDVNIKIIDLAKSFTDEREHFKGGEWELSSAIDYVLNKYTTTSFNPVFVGISILFSTAHKTSLFIADAVKRRWPSVPVVVGGMHSTNAVESLLNSSAIDYVCRGEGESIISRLMTTLASGGDGESIVGIIGRKKLENSRASGQTHFNEIAPFIDELDELPFPAWDLLDIEGYLVPPQSRSLGLGAKVGRTRQATIITSRGCPFSCTFCASRTVHGMKMRFRSIENVLHELKILNEQYGVDVLLPEDDLFTVKKDRIISLCNAIADHFNDKLYFEFANGLSVATLDEDVLLALHRMGMQVANIAIESGSDYVQRHIIKKNCNLNRARTVVETCQKLGIIVRCFFVVGFPGETKEQIQETFDYAASLHSDWNAFQIAAPLIGTEMYNQMLARGDIDSNFNWDTALFQERTFDTKEISATHIKEVVYDANIRVNFFDNYNFKIQRYDRLILLYEAIIMAYPGHLIAWYCLGRAKKASGDIDGWNEALEHCRALLADTGNEMARSHLNCYGKLMPELT